ncbi:MAG: hypothetical protein U9Q24_03335 [Candidatus Ratteibacteria bacterium]|nr:hypothetical protein [Candidatus Ratteibacteria bacterium]
MSNEEKNQENGNVQRTGGEKKLQKELKETDKMVKEEIKDKPYSEKSRQEKRRGRFIDLHADEDGDEQTTEATYRKKR